jgi:hypothetical protein
MTEIEIGYESQGFKLPDGMTWEHVATARAKYEIGAIYVPIVTASGCVGWGVPMIGGRFLQHLNMVRGPHHAED